MQNVLFIHGMFLNPKSWAPWEAFFRQRGYHCIVPAWPCHDGEPAALRENAPAGLGKLSLLEVVDAMEAAAAPYDDLVMIGHSVGGLVVQMLAARGIGKAGVAIASVAPNRMLAFDWGFFRNSATIGNPLKGDDIVPMDADGFHKNFANKMARPASDAAFEAYAVDDSRNVFRDVMTDAAKIDVDAPHVPLLFVGAEDDEIIPARLVERNAKAYTDGTSRSDYIEFSGRGHYICGQPGWEDVATYIANWLDQSAPIPVTRADASKAPGSQVPGIGEIN